VDRADVQNARKCLSEREDYVMTLLYDLHARKNDVPRKLGVNESRVCQINNAALAKLERVSLHLNPEAAHQPAIVSSLFRGLPSQDETHG
jgi:hypothetical protein